MSIIQQPKIESTSEWEFTTDSLGSFMIEDPETHVLTVSKDVCVRIPYYSSYSSFSGSRPYEVTFHKGDKFTYERGVKGTSAASRYAYTNIGGGSDFCVYIYHDAYGSGPTFGVKAFTYELSQATEYGGYIPAVIYSSWQYARYYVFTRD